MKSLAFVCRRVRSSMQYAFLILLYTGWPPCSAMKRAASHTEKIPFLNKFEIGIVFESVLAGAPLPKICWENIFGTDQKNTKEKSAALSTRVHSLAKVHQPSSVIIAQAPVHLNGCRLRLVYHQANQTYTISSFFPDAWNQDYIEATIVDAFYQAADCYATSKKELPHLPGKISRLPKISCSFVGAAGSDFIDETCSPIPIAFRLIMSDNADDYVYSNCNAQCVPNCSDRRHTKFKCTISSAFPVCDNADFYAHFQTLAARLRTNTLRFVDRTFLAAQKAEITSLFAQSTKNREQEALAREVHEKGARLQQQQKHVIDEYATWLLRRQSPAGPPRQRQRRTFWNK